MKTHFLLVCGRNQWRSPTAEHIYRNDDRIEVRSADVSVKSKHVLSKGDVTWEDLILVMENRYKIRIVDRFRSLPFPEIVNLEIPDEYQYMDAELVDLIQKGVEFYIMRFVQGARLS